MNVPDAVRKAVQGATRKHGQVDDQIAEAIREVRDLPEFGSYRELLIDFAIREVVYQVRSDGNKTIRQGEPQPPEATSRRKVKIGACQIIQEMYAELYELSVAGRQLGDLLGEELIQEAEREGATGRGYLAREELLRSLRPLVKDGQAVREAVSGEKLQRLFERAGLRRKTQGVLTLAEAGH